MFCVKWIYFCFGRADYFTFAPEWAALGLRLPRLGKPRAEPPVPEAALGRHVYRLLALLAGMSDGRLLCTEGKYLKFTCGPQCPWPGHSTHADAAMFLCRFALTSNYVKLSEGGSEGGTLHLSKQKQPSTSGALTGSISQKEPLMATETERI